MGLISERKRLKRLLEEQVRILEKEEWTKSRINNLPEGSEVVIEGKSYCREINILEKDDNYIYFSVSLSDKSWVGSHFPVVSGFNLISN